MSISSKEVIAKRLNTLRTSYGLSQQDFAKKVGLSQSAISQFEKAERVPSTTALEKIANAFSLPLGALIAGESAGSDKELLISAVAEKLRGMSKDDIITLDRWVDRMAPPKTDETD